MLLREYGEYNGKRSAFGGGRFELHTRGWLTTLEVLAKAAQLPSATAAVGASPSGLEAIRAFAMTHHPLLGRPPATLNELQAAQRAEEPPGVAHSLGATVAGPAFLETPLSDLGLDGVLAFSRQLSAQTSLTGGAAAAARCGPGSSAAGCCPGAPLRFCRRPG